MNNCKCTDIEFCKKCNRNKSCLRYKGLKGGTIEKPERPMTINCYKDKRKPRAASGKVFS